MPDAWEVTYGLDSFDSSDATGDLDGDGRTNSQEYGDNTDPTDYYDGVPPTITAITATSQEGAPNKLLGLPFGVLVTDARNNPLKNAPILFLVTDGGGSLSPDRHGRSLSSALTVRTDEDGNAAVDYKLPVTLDLNSHVAAKATTGSQEASVTFSVRTISAPANDAFTSPETITGGTGAVTGGNAGATVKPSEPEHADSPSGASVWYRWQASTTGDVILTAGSNFDTLCAIYTGTDLASLNLVNANGDDLNAAVAVETSAVSFHAIAGTQYYIAVDGFNGQTGNIALSWFPSTGPPNDHFTNAFSLTGTSGTLSANNHRDGRTKRTLARKTGCPSMTGAKILQVG